MEDEGDEEEEDAAVAVAVAVAAVPVNKQDRGGGSRACPPRRRCQEASVCRNNNDDCRRGGVIHAEDACEAAETVSIQREETSSSSSSRQSRGTVIVVIVTGANEQWRLRKARVSAKDNFGYDTYAMAVRIFLLRSIIDPSIHTAAFPNIPSTTWHLGEPTRTLRTSGRRTGRHRSETGDSFDRYYADRYRRKNGMFHGIFLLWNNKPSQRKKTTKHETLATTWSDDSQVTDWLQRHVQAMAQHVAEGRQVRPGDPFFAELLFQRMEDV